MAVADFRVKNNLYVLGTGTSVFSGPITSQGSAVLTAADKAVVNGVASLDASGWVPATQLNNVASLIGGNTNELVSKNASGFLSGAANLEVDTDGNLTLIADAPTVTPATDRLTLFASNKASRNTPAYRKAAGADMALQSAFANSSIGMWLITGNANTITPFKLPTPTTAGTVTPRNVATTNRFTAIRRVGLVSANGAGNSVSIFSPTLLWHRGNAAGLGGFYLVMRFGTSDAATRTNPRMFAGMYGTASAIGNVNPTTLLNIVGVGHDSGETVLKMIHNDGSGTGTGVSLGANFPCNSLSVDMYELTLYAPPNAAFINYLVTNLTTDNTASGSLTTNLPVITSLLTVHAWRNNGTNSGAVGLDVASMYIETDY